MDTQDFKNESTVEECIGRINGRADGSLEGLIMALSAEMDSAIKNKKIFFLSTNAESEALGVSLPLWTVALIESIYTGGDYMLVADTDTAREIGQRAGTVLEYVASIGQVEIQGMSTEADGIQEYERIASTVKAGRTVKDFNIPLLLLSLIKISPRQMNTPNNVNCQTAPRDYYPPAIHSNPYAYGNTHPSRAVEATNRVGYLLNEIMSEYGDMGITILRQMAARYKRGQ